MQSKYTAVRLGVLASVALCGAASAQTNPRANQTQTPSQNPPGPVNPADQSTSQSPAPGPAETTGVPGGPSGGRAPGTEEVVGGPPRKAAGEEIVVTGSRVRRKDLTTPAPITVINKEQLTSSGVASVGDFLQQMPEQGGALNTNVNNGGSGETAISLRNLGAQRTLVLVDGKRWVNGASAGVGTFVDLNSIPTAAIERIEVLKDGASAVYGSDAIAGVVNIVTRRRVNGVEFSAYGGTSGRLNDGLSNLDAQQYDVSVTGGAAGDKGSFMVNGEYFDQKSMFANNRDWARFALNYDYSTGEINRGGSGTIPAGRVRVAFSGPQTCVGPLCDALRSAFGSTRRYFTPDPSKPPCPATNAPRDGSCQVQGWRPYIATGPNNDLYNYQAVNYLITPSTRKALFTNGDYHLSDSARAYFQGSFLNRSSSVLLAPEPLVTSAFGVKVSKDNPYNLFGTDLLDVRRRLVEYSGRTQGFDIDTVRGVVGIDGTLPSDFGPLAGVFWDVSFNYGRTAGVTTNFGSLNVQQVGQGLSGPFEKDPATGLTVCGSLAKPTPNCVPVNLFGGPGTITPEMVTALGGYRGIQQGFNQLASVQGNLSAELMKIASDRPVGIAAGYEYRNVYGGFFPDPVGAAGLSFDYNANPTQGQYHVNEGYAELNIPVISNMQYAEDVELQAAVRGFDYSTFGTGATFKVGGRWRPITHFTLRGTYSTGFRAPDVTDLFGGTGPSAEPATDPCAGAAPTSPVGIRCNQFAGVQGAPGATIAGNGDTSVQINSTVGGNPRLTAERARIGTAGVVFEPPEIRGFSATVDYYNIKVMQGLGFITTPVILNGCYVGGNDAYCALIQRDPATGFIRNVSDLEQNIGIVQTSGFDFAIRYSFPTDYGRIGLLLDSTYLSYFRSGQISAAGNYDLGSGSAVSNLTPKWKFNAGVNYGLAGLNLGARVRYIGGFNECAGSDGTSASAGLCSNPSPPVDANGDPIPGGTPYAPHRVRADTKVDLFASYLLRSPFGNSTLSAGIRNVFNRKPPTVYNAFLSYTDPGYDLVGRFGYVRLTHQF